MSEKWSELSPHEALGDSGDSSLASTNGTAPADAAIAVADAPSADSGDPEATTDLEAVADVEPAADASTAEAIATVVADDAADPDDATSSADDGESFLAELARAMQETAAAERQRVAEDIARRRQELIDRVREREASEASRMRELADEDSKVIDAWADEENRKTQAERDRRIAALQDDLSTSLDQHHVQIEAELSGLEASISSYREEIDRYFDVLQQESDPLAIAEHARQRPMFPSLDEPIVASVDADALPAVEGSAVAVAPAEDSAAVDEPPIVENEDSAPASDEVAAEVADPPVVGVMDAEVATTPGIAPWELAPAAPVDPDAGPVAVTAEIGGGSEADAVEAQATAYTPVPRSSNALLRAIPALRPTSSWLGRDSNDRSDGGS